MGSRIYSLFENASCILKIFSLKDCICFKISVFFAKFSFFAKFPFASRNFRIISLHYFFAKFPHHFFAKQIEAKFREKSKNLRTKCENETKWSRCLQPDVLNIIYFKLWILLDRIHRPNYFNYLISKLLEHSWLAYIFLISP